MGVLSRLRSIERKVDIKPCLQKTRIVLLLVFLGFANCGCEKKSDANAANLSYSPIKPQIIHLNLSAQDEGVGGIISVDVNNDGLRDFIVTKPGYVAVCDHSGKELWTKQVNIQVTKQSEVFGLPGWHAPGVQASDVDGDGKTEVLFLTRDNRLHIVQGADGEIRRSIRLESPKGTERWEHLVVANFRGKGDRDLLLQATNAQGYRMGRYLAAYALDDILKRGNVQPIWTREDFLANAHNGARVADLDGDGKDEVLGGTIVGANGRILFQIPIEGHIDSIFVADVRQDISGLEVIALEEGGGNHIFLYNDKRLIWKSHYKHKEPQNAAIGEFDLVERDLEIWCRSRYDTHQKPFVFGAQGNLISYYEMDRVAPEDWTIKGVEVIFTIEWTGGPRQMLAAKERHKSGDVVIFDPITGQFLHRFNEKADRLYVADVCGDWREELIVLNGNELHIYLNDKQNPNPDRPRLWAQKQYLRNKMTWNYYSP